MKVLKETNINSNKLDEVELNDIIADEMIDLVGVTTGLKDIKDMSDGTALVGLFIKGKKVSTEPVELEFNDSNKRMTFPNNPYIVKLDKKLQPVPFTEDEISEIKKSINVEIIR